MKNSFAYRLWNHSKLAVLGLFLFASIYAVLFYKKMDMVLFPYNAMFAFQPAHSGQVMTHGMKLNDTLVSITRFPYWKKDFLEASLNSYAVYSLTGSVFLQQYFKDRQYPPAFESRLVPRKEGIADWPAWYISFAGCGNGKPGKAEIWRYTLGVNDGAVMRSDSMLIYSIQW